MKTLFPRLLLSLCVAALVSCSTTTEPTPAPERLFLQQVTNHSAIIKWRGEHNKACIQTPKTAAKCLPASNSDTGHKEVLFSDLSANTHYQYSVGNYENEALHFHTAPVTGSAPRDKKIRLWILGDSGTASEVDHHGNMPHKDDAKAVMDGFLSYNQQQTEQQLDMILMLGDNAYEEGTDAQWQTAVFELYRPLLSQTALWPTIGNHEMGAETITAPGYGTVTWGGISRSDSADSFHTRADPTPRRTPYLDIFTLPTQAEAGGIPSGTEQYYSFNYGNLHIVSLDSQLSMRNPSQRATMRDWLINDLSASQQDWTIVIFHHPPYTKGSHDSDTAMAMRMNIDEPIVLIREQFTQIFEDYGVDMVYSGHSHTYERSYYLHGHRGDANTFDASIHAELNSKGAPAIGQGNEPYQQISPSSKLNDKVVYTVAGSAGKVSIGDGKLDHPAHVIQTKDPEQRHGLAELGSVLLETTEHELTALFINSKGEVFDSVSIQR